MVARQRTGLVIGLVALAVGLVVVTGVVVVVGHIRDRRADATRFGAGSITEHTLTIDGRDRTYRVYVPPGLPSGPVPLVLGLHGGTGSGEQFEGANGLDQVSDANGFIAVYPDGIAARVDVATGLRTWNGGDCCGRAARDDVDDVAFIGAVIAEVKDAHSIDASRVFAIGHSNGAIMAYRLACELSDQITGIGVYAGTLGIDQCHMPQPVSVMAAHGEDDTNVPFDGGQGTGISRTDFRSVPDTLAMVTAADGCDPTPAASRDAVPGTKVETWSSCAGDVEVELVIVTGATHAWPGGTRNPDAGVTYDATAELYAFLDAHPRAA